MTDLTFEEQDLIIDKLIERYQATKIIVDEARGVSLNDGMFDVAWLYKSKTHWMCRDAIVELSGDESLIYPINYLQQKYFQDILTPTENELTLFELSQGFEWPLQDKFLKKEIKE